MNVVSHFQNFLYRETG